MRLLTNAERQARWRAKRNALARKAVLDQARKPWDLHEARKGDARGYADEVRGWWTASRAVPRDVLRPGRQGRNGARARRGRRGYAAAGAEGTLKRRYVTGSRSPRYGNPLARSNRRCCSGVE
jgi:hypothetical protein